MEDSVIRWATRQSAAIQTSDITLTIASGLTVKMARNSLVLKVRTKNLMPILSFASYKYNIYPIEFSPKQLKNNNFHRSQHQNFFSYQPSCDKMPKLLKY